MAVRYDGQGTTCMHLLIPLSPTVYVYTFIHTQVESVIIKHQGRNTLCVSSQVGCQMACTFCATGTMGLTGNLMGGEIAEQVGTQNET